MRNWNKNRVVILYTFLFFIWIFRFDWIKNTLLFFLDSKTSIIQRTSLSTLAYQHLTIVLISTLLSIIIGFSLGIWVRLSRSIELRQLILQFSTIGETLPTAAIIALSVPLLGYGNIPLILALCIYGILPIVRNTIVGLDTIPNDIQEAAQGIGLTRFEQLIRVEIPIALPAIMTGIRIATVINVSAATIGATVGAGGFGVMIIAGIRTYDTLMVVQASVPVILMALWFDRILRVESY
ncbi:MAG: ABC transporter permease [Erysipelotrichaceae bacterium]|nr:ABC transporter permease [Erysipelotrichaceae bacterium]